MFEEKSVISAYKCKRTHRRPEVMRTHTQEQLDHKDPQMARMEEDPHQGAIGPERPADGQDGGGSHTQEQVDPMDPQKTRMEEEPHPGATGPEGPTGPMVREACRIG